MFANKQIDNIIHFLTRNDVVNLPTKRGMYELRPYKNNNTKCYNFVWNFSHKIARTLVLKI